jgi:regulator of protease activity HflC (stomatin/prohibitin superfamily)
MAPKLYNKFRQNDMIALANSYIRNTVREALNEVASKMKVEEIYGVGKTAMLKEVADRCRERLGTFGVSIDQLTINGALRLPPLIADAINRALEASQNAAQSRNRVAQVEAEARQAITQATGAAEAARLRAQGEGDAVIIRARAEAQANESIRLSMTPAMMQYRAIERWDGRMPMFQGGDKMPLLTFDAAKLDTLDEPTRQKRLKELFDSARPAPIPSAIPTIAPTSAPHFPVPVPSAVPAPR